MNKLYILLPVHNRKNITQQFISCLKKQTFTNYHLILIDDGSTDGTEEMVRSQISNLTIIKGDGTRWWGGSLHQGFLWLKSQSINLTDFVLIINDDVLFDKEYFNTAINILKEQTRTLLITQVYGKESQQLIDGAVYIDWKRWKVTLQKDVTNFNCASTRGLFFRVSDFMEIGGFHPILLPHYGSDYEFTIRATRKGFQLLINENLKAIINEQTTGFHDLTNEKTYGQYLKKLFSKKSTMNPIYLTNLIAFSSPWQWKISNWLLVWSSTFWKIARYFFIFCLFRSSNKSQK